MLLNKKLKIMKSLSSFLMALMLVLSLNAGAQQTKTAAKPADKKEVKATNSNAPETKGPVKKDGTPDKRYKSNKKLKKDGTPDKRYNVNKETATK